MAEIVNLQRIKKQRARAAATEQAAQNRARHGRTPMQKLADAASEAKRRALLDGARKDDTPA